MGCGSCSSGACGSGSVPAGCGNNGHCASGGCNKLDVFDWLADINRPSLNEEDRVVEVRFKNTRKEFYRFPSSISLNAGDNVVVKSSFGNDIGTVSLTGELVKIQMAKKGLKSNYKNTTEIIRLADQSDIDLWRKNQSKENETMIKARKLASELKLDMKISDVEYQGDGSKAIFYYTAEGRVDFRELIRSFAGTFKVRVEMKQIGARQEAGRVGGIGSCGRELCCSTWLTDFRSVSTSAARYQQLAINPVKLAGQCGKLKCCLNYELDSYLDALKDFPKGDVKLKTKKGLAYCQKTDIFKRTLWFNFKDDPAVFHALSLDRVNQILEMNAKGKFPENLLEFVDRAPVDNTPDYNNVDEQDDLKRFDRDKNKKNKKRRNKQRGRQQQAQGSKQGGQHNKKRSGNPQNNRQNKKKQQGNQDKNKPNSKHDNKGNNQGKPKNANNKKKANPPKKKD